MRTFLGMILGCVLTIGAVYIHDVNASSSLAASTTGVEARQIVNWDVAAADWDKMKLRAHNDWIKLSSK